MTDLDIRPERTDDAVGVRNLVTTAFGSDDDTADFVQAVWERAEVCLAQVAVAGDAIVGHAQWCAAPLIVDGRPVRGAYLTCLSAAPDLQRRGVGSRLVTGGLDRLREMGFQVASLLGDPAYYGRFGFSSDLAARIDAPHRSRGVGFQAVELVTGALDGEVVRGDFPAVIAPGDPGDAPP
ncbi:GNAT family N-acetyltransferase [Phenylobacterium sp.]|uniref:GNAT family N-acetyltransferase n=1 Tax=Phenylobacterium sp. TaxID=1871053 RepID=UPI0027164915|nr:N-acetyltransferase [Phenylobacterium sp.]MDO8380976.1 N-acetyltransferase [Phenylobacterium sp.]